MNRMNKQDIKPKRKRYIVSFSFVNYLHGASGIAKVILAHQQMYNNADISYINLFAVKKMVCDDKYTLFCVYGLIVDGEYKGIYQMNQLIDMFQLWNISGGKMLDIHIHHLLYIKLGQIRFLLSSFSNVPIKVYIHDYYNACSNYTLIRNGETYCGGLGLNPEHCAGCRSYINSLERTTKIHAFLDEFSKRIIFISPSEVAKKVFCNFYVTYQDKVMVIPHQCFDMRYTGNMDAVAENSKIIIGFLGRPAFHKGWRQWEKLCSVNKKDSYELLLFNSYDETYPNMRTVKIGYMAENLNAMTDALTKHKVDVVLLWALWPETYSYTCFEAFSANTFIITNTISGNITDVVKNNRNGIILNSESELFELFDDPHRLRELVNTFKKSAIYGPNQLYENPEIVRLSLLESGEELTTANLENKSRFVNLPLLWLLRWMYTHGKIRG